MLRLICLTLLVTGGSAVLSGLAQSGSAFIGTSSTTTVIKATHTQLADTTAATFECLHGDTVLGEIGITAQGTLLADSIAYSNQLGGRVTLADESTTEFKLIFATLQYVDQGVVITCRDKQAVTDAATHTIAITAYMTIAATANPTVPVVGSALEITGAWAGSGTYADTSTIEVTCGSEVTQLAIATVTIDAGGNTFVNEDNENAPVVIGAAEVAGTAIALSGKTIKLTIAKLQQDDLGKMCKFTQETGDVAVYSIPSPSGAASLTCGFSILLALAVALREFMSG